MNKKQLIIFSLTVAFLCISVSAFAYNEDYPPYRFGNEYKKHFRLEGLTGGKQITEDINYKSSDGSFGLRKTNPKDSFFADSLVIKIKNKVVFDGDYFKVTGFFKADLDDNGLDDYIVTSTVVANGLLAFAFGENFIFLGRGGGDYQTIYFGAIYPSDKDFLDINNDGKAEIIIGDFEYVKSHAYWYYNIYEIKDDKLVNANSKFKGFPKFIWFTEKSNDKDTTRLTKEEKESLVVKRNKSIGYGVIRQDIMEFGQ